MASSWYANSLVGTTELVERVCPKVAQSGHRSSLGECPLLGEKRTCAGSDNHAYRKLCRPVSAAIGTSDRAAPFIKIKSARYCGTTPVRPTLIRAVCSVPSGILSARTMAM